MVVEDHQVVMGIGCHPNDVRHRQQTAVGGDSLSGTGFQLLQRGGDDDGGRKSVVLSQRSRRQYTATQLPSKRRDGLDSLEHVEGDQVDGAPGRGSGVACRRAPIRRDTWCFLRCRQICLLNPAETERSVPSAGNPAREETDTKE